MRDHFLGFTVHVHHKGGNSQQEMQKANALSQQQLNIMQSQLAMQANQLAMVNPTLQSIIGAGGMLPAQEAAMRTQALQGLGQQYQGLEGQIGQQLTARGITGGQFAGGGGIAQQFGQLGAMEAGQQSNLLNQIQLAKGQNLMGALQTGLGEAGMFGSQALGFGGQGVNALGVGQQAANAADQASTGFWGSLIGGLTGMVNPIKIPGTGCWVVAELYGGWFTPQMKTIRPWLLDTWYMRPFAIFYLRFGKRWANWIHRSQPARFLTKLLFDCFLVIARG